MLNLPQHGVVLASGSIAAELDRRGAGGRARPEFHNTLRADLVRQIYADFAAAGCRWLIANSAGINRFVLERYGCREKVEELATAAAVLARDAAAATGAKVLGAMGPTGEVMLTASALLRERAAAAFAEAAEALAWGAADAILLDGFCELAELRLALHAARRACDLPVVATMTFAHGPGRDRTALGDSPQQLATLARREGIDAIGVSCGGGPEHHAAIVAAIRAESDLPVFSRPDAGEGVLVDRQMTWPMRPDDFARAATAVADAGAAVIGGCCGVMVAHVAALARGLAA
jgi:methionine synthase I (cobalamin-dependent)